MSAPGGRVIGCSGRSSRISFPWSSSRSKSWAQLVDGPDPHTNNASRDFDLLVNSSGEFSTNCVAPSFVASSFLLLEDDITTTSLQPRARAHWIYTPWQSCWVTVTEWVQPIHFNLTAKCPKPPIPSIPTRCCGPRLWCLNGRKLVIPAQSLFRKW